MHIQWHVRVCNVEVYSSYCLEKCSIFFGKVNIVTLVKWISEKKRLNINQEFAFLCYTCIHVPVSTMVSDFIIIIERFSES